MKNKFSVWNKKVLPPPFFRIEFWLLEVVASNFCHFSRFHTIHILIFQRCYNGNILKKKYCIYGNLQILIWVGCGYLVKSYWIQYAKPKPHLGFLEKLRCIYIYQILHLILNHYRMLTQLKSIFLRPGFFGGYSPRYSRSHDLLT